ncbi:hypothetical protein ACIF8T_18670 [Streptomyces sp. NPDC085946]|uniref:hypothetical protein n=1 Tax=Streptomyces sp. NPDC085946 TaxID=3365744 RepID=UPI0037D974AE
MTRTTPPRPLDVTALFPEVAALARTAVRLHPRAGAPTAADSSVGGPLLWPADEPWPTCPEHTGPSHHGLAPADIRLRRRILAQAHTRPRADGDDLLTPEERALVDRASERRRIPQDGPVPMVPVAQLHASDVPGLPCPDGTDVLQVLWCPFDHAQDHLPRTVLRWRAAADVVGPPADPPRPAVVGNAGYLPEPCVVHPEPVTEYPAPHELPEELADRIDAWEEAHEERCDEDGTDDEDDLVYYQYDLSVAPGTKVGGHAPWSFSDPCPLSCPECGADVTPLLTLDGTEWDGGSGSWRPLEDADYDGLHVMGPACDTHLAIGRGYCLQLYVCTASYAHPHLQNMQ